MNKNIIWVLLILLVPLGIYIGLSKDKMTTTTEAAVGDEIIKFSSPMCYECQELEKVFNTVLPKYIDKVSLRHVNVTINDKATNSLIKEYNVKLVPTTVFKNQDGKITQRVEGSIKPEMLEQYFEELINE